MMATEEAGLALAREGLETVDLLMVYHAVPGTVLDRLLQKRGFGMDTVVRSLIAKE
jgi:hypothetical protein